VKNITFKKKAIEMESIPNLCASKEVAQRSCKKNMMCLWWGTMENEPQELL
jgi:hypothetical protein